MSLALPTALQPEIINERISRLKVQNTIFQKAFGLGLGGANVRQTPSRRGTYDVFNETRDLPPAVTPGAVAATMERQPVGFVNFQIPRSATNTPILMEEVNQLRPIGGPAGEIDQLGEKYILDQEAVIRQRNVNLREFQIASMLRGSYTFTQAAPDRMIHDFSGGTITVDFQVPSGNKSQLDMLGAGDIIGTSWANPAAPIVRDILAIDQAFQQLTGRPLTDIWVNSTGWGHVIVNTEVQNTAGTVNNPVESITRDNSDDNLSFTAILKAVPWVTWHITNHALNIGTANTTTRLISDTMAVFTARMDSSVVQYWECPEPVVDPITGAMSNQFGEYYYAKAIDNPVSYELHSRFNGLPVLKIPAAVAPATIVF
jgi:hypothetical protein